ncbi:MAG: hypothetical protein OER43_16550, partial [Gammaproteobacteria bacterium]|nr:hypothetical protein [Gammaproteobacteria bacterium]
RRPEFITPTFSIPKRHYAIPSALTLLNTLGNLCRCRPAAGIHLDYWIPAFAGMTVGFRE